MFSSQAFKAERMEKWLSPLYWTDVNAHSALYVMQSNDSESENGSKGGPLKVLPMSVTAVGSEDRPLFPEARGRLESSAAHAAKIGESFGKTFMHLHISVICLSICYYIM